MAGRIPRRENEQFVIRMPPGMRDRLKRRADENRRSLNSEIVCLLETAEAGGNDTGGGEKLRGAAPADRQ